MEKKEKRLLYLLLILPLLLLVLGLMRRYNDKQEEQQKAEKEAATIYVTEIAEVNTINYHTGSAEFVFEKEDDRWIYKQDPDFPLAQSYPEQIASTFGKLTALRELEDGDALEDYGLTEPMYTVNLVDSDGNKTDLRIGNAVNDAYYLLNESTEKIYTVSSTLTTMLQYSLEEMAQLDTYPNIGSGNLKKK